MSQILSSEEHRILYLLAKRNHPSITSGWLDYDPLNSEYWTCLVCNQSKTVASESPVTHAIFHLKESNLLPFV